MDPVYPDVKQSIVLCLILLLLQFLCGVVIAIVLLIFGRSDLMNNPMVMMLPSSLMILSILLWGYRKTKLPIFEVYKFDKFKITVFIPLILLSWGTGIICSEIDNFFRYFFPAPDFIQKLMNDLVSEGTSSFLAVVILAPVTEELLFRGLIFNGLLSQYSINKSVLVSALLFMLIHMNPYQFASAFIFGVISAYIFLITGSLLPCIICHALLNVQPFIVKYLLKIEIAGYTTSTNPLEHSFQPLWFDTLGVVLFSIGLYYLITYYRKYQSSNPENADDNFNEEYSALS